MCVCLELCGEEAVSGSAVILQMRRCPSRVLSQNTLIHETEWKRKKRQKEIKWLSSHSPLLSRVLFSHFCLSPFFLSAPLCAAPGTAHIWPNYSTAARNSPRLTLNMRSDTRGLQRKWEIQRKAWAKRGIREKRGEVMIREESQAGWE